MTEHLCFSRKTLDECWELLFIFRFHVVSSPLFSICLCPVVVMIETYSLCFRFAWSTLFSCPLRLRGVSLWRSRFVKDRSHWKMCEMISVKHDYYPVRLILRMWCRKYTAQVINIPDFYTSANHSFFLLLCNTDRERKTIRRSLLLATSQNSFLNHLSFNHLLTGKENPITVSHFVYCWLGKWSALDWWGDTLWWHRSLMPLQWTPLLLSSTTVSSMFSFGCSRTSLDRVVLTLCVPDKRHRLSWQMRQTEKAVYSFSLQVVLNLLLASQLDYFMHSCVVWDANSL
jgi:hypothetical protein